MLTIAPCGRPSRCGRISRDRWTGASKLMASSFRVNAQSSRSARTGYRWMPALLTRTFSAGNRVVAQSMRATRSASSATLQTRVATAGWVSASSRSRSSRRPQTRTVLPARRKRSTSARPIPEAPPVTRTVFEASRISRNYPSLTSIAHDTTRFDVERDLAYRQTSLIAKLLGQVEKRGHVGKVRHHADRHANGSRALAPAMLHELPKAGKRHVVARFGRCQHVFRGESFGHLTGAGVAEAAGSKRDVPLVGQLLDAPIVDQVAIWIVKIHGQRATPRCRRGRPVDADHGPPVAVAQPE